MAAVLVRTLTFLCSVFSNSENTLPSLNETLHPSFYYLYSKMVAEKGIEPLHLGYEPNQPPWLYSAE